MIWKWFSILFAIFWFACAIATLFGYRPDPIVVFCSMMIAASSIFTDGVAK